MNAFIITAALLAFAGASVAQDATRGSTPPGASQDGSSAADGAIKGGSIQPGERSGMPEQSSPAAVRCKELQGTLREQCLKDAAGASTGGTRPEATPTPVERDQRTDPPPQNPR